MGLRLARIAVLAAMIFGGVLLALVVSYALHGSLEEFPTAEQQDEVRTVAAGIAGALLVLEGALLLALRRIGRAAADRASGTLADPRSGRA